MLRYKDCPPPHCSVLTCVEFSEKSWGVDAETLNLIAHILKVEENLNPHLPQLRLKSQCSFALGDIENSGIELHFVGFWGG